MDSASLQYATFSSIDVNQTDWLIDTIDLAQINLHHCFVNNNVELSRPWDLENVQEL